MSDTPPARSSLPLANVRQRMLHAAERLDRLRASLASLSNELPDPDPAIVELEAAPDAEAFMLAALEAVCQDYLGPAVTQLREAALATDEILSQHFEAWQRSQDEDPETG